MAAAEARAVWQRTVNRCFVQEDAKRSPKLTCCQSSSYSSSTASTKQVEDSGSSRAVVDPQNQSCCTGSKPLHRNPNFPSHHHHIQVKKPLEAEVNTQGISELGAGEKQTNNPESFQKFIESMETYGSIGYDESSEKNLNELSFDPSSPWNPLSSEKAGPWWRTTDKDELVSLVAQRPLDYVENCDLPTPQEMNCSYFGSEVFQDYSVYSQTIHEHGTSRGSSGNNRTEASSESYLSNSELLEGLRHFQTRAREAEIMAKEAYAEKEHLVKLLFKQTSELFGYKKWLKLLQLEIVYLQIKNKKIENNNKNSKRRSKRDKPNTAKYVVGLALGMSLVGAGLLLGWTVGWIQMLSF